MSQGTAFSATQAAQAITELGKAGVSTAAIHGGALKGALDLAAAGELSVAEAAETAASAMTQFGLDGALNPHIADLRGWRWQGSDPSMTWGWRRIRSALSLMALA